MGFHWEEISNSVKRLKMKGKLVIISHTEHFIDSKGLPVGWGPTVREINALSTHFSEITHIAVLHNSVAPNSSLGYTAENTRFIPLKPTGGKNIWAKLKICWNLLSLLRVVRKELKGAEFVQLRLPTGIGVFLLPYFAITKWQRSFTFWVKYAGNWNESKPPMSYAFQRWFLKKDFCKCKVTINGFWQNQPKHCISFENPCLSLEQLKWGSEVGQKKIFRPPFNLIFIGRLEDEKGVWRIINAINKIKPGLVKNIKFIGEGKKKNIYIEQTVNLSEVQFLGALDNASVHKNLEEAHFLVLPSTASEGFPKVIAEAGAYGVVPIVSDVGSIAQYINEGNGFVCSELDVELEFAKFLDFSLQQKEFTLKTKSDEIKRVASLFSFENYLNNISNYLLK